MQTIEVKAAQDSGMQARGSAIAVSLFNLVKAQAGDMLRYLKDITDLNQAGRTEFRKVLEQKRREMRSTAKEFAGSPFEDVTKRTGASAFVRISEALSFSKAVDAGFVPDFDTGYHWNIAEGRAFLESQSATGPTMKRGRKAQTKVQKACAFLDKLGLTDAEQKAIANALLKA